MWEISLEAIKIYEEKRKSLVFFTLISNIFYLGAGYFLLKSEIFNLWILFGWIVGYIVLWKIIVSQKNRFINSCKEELIKPEIEKEGLEYEPDTIVDLNLVDESGLIDEEYDDFDGGDFVRGDNFIFSYLYLTREEEYTTTNDDGEMETETRTVTVFDGIFFVGAFPKKIKGHYFVKKNSIHLSDILPIFTDKDRIKLDMPEFEKVFDVYGSDQIEGRYIFDFTFMRNLLNLYNFLSFAKMSIIRDKYYIAFPGLKFKNSLLSDMKKCIEYNVNLIYALSSVDKILFKERG